MEYMYSMGRPIYSIVLKQTIWEINNIIQWRLLFRKLACKTNPQCAVLKTGLNQLCFQLIHRSQRIPGQQFSSDLRLQDLLSQIQRPDRTLTTSVQGSLQTQTLVLRSKDFSVPMSGQGLWRHKEGSIQHRPALRHGAQDRVKLVTGNAGRCSQWGSWSHVQALSPVIHGPQISIHSSVWYSFWSWVRRRYVSSIQKCCELTLTLYVRIKLGATYSNHLNTAHC